MTLLRKTANKITLKFNNHRQFTPFCLAPLVGIQYKNNTIRVSVEKAMKPHMSGTERQSI